VCFRDPSAVRYRYRLKGLDAAWREVGSDLRVASYTAAPAGAYLFEVQARTGRSDWSEPGASLAVTVLPPWRDLWWVRLAGLALVLAAGATAYRLRLAQINRRYAIRFEERIAERTRIARDIHDSLLQGFQGLILQLQAIRNILPDQAQKAAEMLDLALDRADSAVIEGRDTVNELRSSAGSDRDLPEALAAIGDELLPLDGPRPSISLVIEGSPHDLSALVRDEVLAIAREAVRNAVRHASAHRIEIELSYDRRSLVLRVRDDGIGMDSHTLANGGRRGHWGLAGMRERANRIGGRLTIWSRSGAGAEIELVLPAKLAFAQAGARSRIERERRQAP
jgi:signal transduction histidine kinase